MRMQKRHRELLQQLQPVLDELGAEITGFEARGSGHMRITVRFIDCGAVGYITCGNSPSDWRAAMNTGRDLRKQAALVRGRQSASKVISGS